MSQSIDAGLEPSPESLEGNSQPEDEDDDTDAAANAEELQPRRTARKKAAGKKVLQSRSWLNDCAHAAWCPHAFCRDFYNLKECT